MRQKTLIVCLLLICVSCVTSSRMSETRKYEQLRDCMCQWLESNMTNYGCFPQMYSDLTNASVVFSDGIVSFGRMEREWVYIPDDNTLIYTPFHPQSPYSRVIQYYAFRFTVIYITGSWRIIEYERYLERR